MPPTSSFAYLNGLRFHYLNWGGVGRPIVLVHGLASNARIWDLTAPALAAHGRVLALDQRSHGRTDPAESGYDFPSIVRDLQAFLEALHLERPLLVGHSWGASTVLLYAALRTVGPLAPAGIVMVDGGLFSMSDVPGLTWEKAEVMLRPPDLDGMPVADFRARLSGWLPPEVAPETAAEIILASFRVDDDERLFRRLPIPQHMLIARAIYEKKAFEHFARVRCPILLCPARQHPADERAAQFLHLKEAGAQRAAEVNPRVTTHWFDDTVHDIPLHRPQALADAILAFAETLTD